MTLRVPVTASNIPDWIRKAATTINQLINNATSAGGTAAWGGITGTLTDQTDLQTALNAKQSLDSDLTALASNSTNGLWARTGSGTGAARTLTAGSAKIAVTFGNGQSGNPTVDLGSVASTDLSNSADIARLSVGGTFAADISVPDEAYDATAWNGSLEVPTKNAIRDKIETLGGAGTVTTTGSPASGNLTKFSGATSITNGDLSGDVTTSGTLTTTIANDVVTYAKIQNVSATSRLLGRASSGAGDVEEISVSGGSFSGTTLTVNNSYEAGPPTPPTAADLATWDNQGTSTWTDGTGAAILKPQVDDGLHGRYKTAPATPYDLYCRLDVQVLSTSAITTGLYHYAGIMFKDTGGDNERLTFGLIGQRIGGDENVLWSAEAYRWSGASPPVIGTQVNLKYNTAFWRWIRVNNDGTTLTFYVSMDGRNWFSVGTETLAAHIDAAASFGVFSRSGSAATESVALFSYFSTTAPS